MATPLARFVSISVKGEAAREATPVGIKRESKRASATRLGPSAGENVAAHRAGDGALLPLLTGIRAAHLIARASKSQRSVIGQVHTRKISAWRDCGAMR